MQNTLPAVLLVATACASPGATRKIETAAANPPSTQSLIERREIEAAQHAWCDALLAISRAARGDEDPKKLAERVLSTAYDYDRGPVLFKPTLTHGAHTFRMNKRGALAYFVGGDAQYPEDAGFARKPWVSCEPAIAEIVALSHDAALAMGNVTVTDGTGAQIKVDKTFGYRRDSSGNLRIVLHHSSLPYTPPAEARSAQSH